MIRIDFLALLILIGLFSCDRKRTTMESDNRAILVDRTDTVKFLKSEITDSIYKIGDFLFEAKSNAVFEFVEIGKDQTIASIDDTLYVDNDVIMLGDRSEIKSFGIFKNFKFKSSFKDFAVDSLYTGKLADPDFTSDPQAKRFITRIKRGCNELGVNFAGQYTIIEWGCGAACQEMALVNRVNGKIIFSQIPFDTVDGHCGVDYKAESRLLFVNTEALSESWGYEKGYKLYDYWRVPSAYELKDGELFKLE